MVKFSVLRGLMLSLVFAAVSCPSIAYTVFPADSIRVKWMEGKKYILHKVELKETWVNLAKRYNCTLSDLKAANSGVEQLKTGQIINIPSGISAPVKTGTTTISKPAIVTAPQPSLEMPSPVVPAGSGNPGTYTVKKSETLYSISKRFNKSVDEMKALNNLASDELSEGQVLIVTSGTSAASSTPSPKINAVANSSVVQPTASRPTPPTTTKPVQEEKNVPVATPTPAHKNNGVSPAAGYEKPTKSISPVKKGNTGKTLMQVTETGVATWIQDGQVKSDRYFALHRSAPIGTIIRITNRMNNQFVYVKVVGALPDTGENENIIIKVSQAVSAKLIALDPLFQVELSYGMMQ